MLTAPAAQAARSPTQLQRTIQRAIIERLLCAQRRERPAASALTLGNETYRSEKHLLGHPVRKQALLLGAGRRPGGGELGGARTAASGPPGAPQPNPGRQAPPRAPVSPARVSDSRRRRLPETPPDWASSGGPPSVGQCCASVSVQLALILSLSRAAASYRPPPNLDKPVSGPRSLGASRVASPGQPRVHWSGH